MSWAALVDERGQKASEQMRGPVLNAPQKESLSAGFASPDISGQAPNLTRDVEFLSVKGESPSFFLPMRKILAEDLQRAGK
jgi:hypothetical protein